MTESSKAPVRCATCGATHRYDCPNIGPVRFLQAVMHDPTVPICDRMYAADALLWLEAQDIYHDQAVSGDVSATIIIPEQEWVQ